MFHLNLKKSFVAFYQGLWDPPLKLICKQLYCKGERFRVSRQRDPSLQTESQIYILLLFCKNSFHLKYLSMDQPNKTDYSSQEKVTGSCGDSTSISCSSSTYPTPTTSISMGGAVSSAPTPTTGTLGSTGNGNGSGGEEMYFGYNGERQEFFSMNLNGRKSNVQPQII